MWLPRVFSKSGFTVESRLSAVLIVVLVLSLSACGGNTLEEANGPQPNQSPAPAPGADTSGGATPPPNSSSPLELISGSWRVRLTTATGSPSLQFTTVLRPEATDDDDFEGSDLTFERGGVDCFAENAEVDGHLSEDNAIMVLRLRSRAESGGDENRLEIEARLNSARNSANGTYEIEARSTGCNGETGTAVLNKF